MSELIRIKGAEDIKIMLKELPLKLQKRALSKSIKSGADDIKNEAISLVPVDSGTLKGAIKSGIKTTRFGVYGRVIVEHGYRRTKQGKKKVRNDAFYWRWVEFGHRLVKNGKQVGMVAAKPFLRPAFDRRAREVVDDISAGIIEQINNIKAGQR